MAKTGFKSVDDYISTRPDGAQPTLRRVRSVIRKALPGAEDAISYQIPAYRLAGGTVLHFAGWKEHYSLYPATRRLVAAMNEVDRAHPGQHVRRRRQGRADGQGGRA